MNKKLDTTNKLNTMNKLNIFGLLLAFLVFTGCLDDLDQEPLADNAFTEIQVFENAQEAKKALAKCYGALALTGQEGATGHSDLDGSVADEGASQYSRLLFNLNEVTTDHIKCAWIGDVPILSLQEMNWGSDNGYIQAMYYRLGQSVSFCNSFIISAKQLGGGENVQQYIAEARFLRAYLYYNLMDLFGSPSTCSQPLSPLREREEFFFYR